MQHRALVILENVLYVGCDGAFCEYSTYPGRCIYHVEATPSLDAFVSNGIEYFPFVRASAERSECLSKFSLFRPVEVVDEAVKTLCDHGGRLEGQT